MRQPFPRAAIAGAALCASAALGGCGPGGERDAAPPAKAVPAWDRDVARREVWTAVLDGFHAKDASRLFVVHPTVARGRTYDEDFQPSPEFAAAVVRLPDGRKVVRPDLEGLAAGTFDDWVAHAETFPAPRDLRASLPITWFSGEDWKALRPVTVTGEGDEHFNDPSPRWTAFHVRFRGAGGWIGLGDVGFSPAHDQAVLQTSFSCGGLCGSGHWLLLRLEAGRWVIVGKAMTWVS